MMKHIIGQSIYQMTVMMICYFGGTKFLIAESDEAQKQVDSNYVVSGLKIDGYDEKSQGASTHLTYCFNIFVMMQIFNFMNARKLDDEFNTFGGLKWSSYFTPIVITIFILQIMILTVGNIAFRSAPWGLGIIGWLISLLFGFGGMVVNIILKCIPEDKCMSGKADHPKNNTAKRMNSLSVRRFGGGSSYNKNSGQNSGNSKNLEKAV